MKTPSPQEAAKTDWTREVLKKTGEGLDLTHPSIEMIFELQRRFGIALLEADKNGYERGREEHRRRSPEASRGLWRGEGERRMSIPVYTPEELTYAAATRCRCGHGIAYVKEPRDSETGRNWNCSKLLTTELKMRHKKKGNPLFGLGVIEDEKGELHDGPRPFISWEVKAEGQPSANGATTRP